MSNIVINITPAVRPTTGIGTYAKELVLSLLKLDGINNYTLFFSKNLFSKNTRIDIDSIKKPSRNFFSDTVRSQKVNLKAIWAPYRILNFLWNKLGVLPVEHLCGRCDIFHSLDMVSPIVDRAKLLTTIHDIHWIFFNDDPESRTRALYRGICNSLNRSRIIIVNSNFTKKEILERFPFLKEDRVEVVYWGVSDAFRPLNKSLTENMKKKYNWEEFILYVGVLDQSRKNLIRLVKAYSNLKIKNKIKEKLVLCGRISKNSKALLSVIERLNLFEDIIIHSRWIPEEDMPLIYNMAKVVVYPSLYEGFGFPILEAMACGTPVVASKVASIPEVGGDACFYIDPYDINNLANGIYKVLYDEALREKLSAVGLNHVKKFTWRNVACMVMDLYKKILN